MGKVFLTDLEGPLALNDNAFEMACAFLPAGEKLFSLVSAYDDYLFTAGEREGYQAGDTLRLLAPFFRAAGVTVQTMKEFSRENLFLLPKAEETIQEIAQAMPAYVISTSYEPYVHAFAERTGFPPQNTFSTAVWWDDFDLEVGEKRRLLEAAGELAKLSPIDFEATAGGKPVLDPAGREAVEQLNEFFFGEFPQMEAGRLVEETQVVGAAAKAQSVLEAAWTEAVDIADVMYTGDSITDVEALELVKKEEGLSLAFNANRYALRAAEAACLSGDSAVLAELAAIFRAGGRQAVLQRVAESAADSGSTNGARLYLVGSGDTDVVISESERFRKEVRGKAGRLG